MTTWPRPFFLVNGSEGETMSMKHDKADLYEEDGDLGVFAFAKKTAALLVPMAIIAGLFAMWLRAELLVVRQEFGTALSAHEKQDLATLVSRGEYEAMMKLQDERYQRLHSEMSLQGRMINRNTILLERISQKLGIQRPPE